MAVRRVREGEVFPASEGDEQQAEQKGDGGLEELDGEKKGNPDVCRTQTGDLLEEDTGAAERDEKGAAGAESGEEMPAAERQPPVISIRPLLSPSAYGASAGIREIARCRGRSRRKS